MDQTNSLTGPYEYEGFLVYKMPYFVYEVTVSKYWKKGYCLLGSKYYKANKPLKIKKPVILEQTKDYIIRKEINIIGVPDISNLPIHVPYKKKTKNGTRRSIKGSVH